MGQPAHGDPQFGEQVRQGRVFGQFAALDRPRADELDLALEGVGAGEHEVHRLALQEHLALAGQVQQVLGLVREHLHGAQAEHAGHALDRVEPAVHRVERVRVGRVAVDRQQVPVRGLQVLGGLGAEVADHRAVLVEERLPGRARHLHRGQFAEARRGVRGGGGL
nr:hypothetical protein [Gemmata sp. SH-PL17]